MVRLARKTQSLDILYAIATGLSQPGSLEQLLDGFLDTLIELVDARAASVRVGDRGRQYAPHRQPRPCPRRWSSGIG